MYKPRANSVFQFNLNVALSLFALCIAAPSLANTDTLYGDFSDIPPGSVTFTDVFEREVVLEPPAPISAPTPRFGMPSITGNNLDFDLIEFSAAADNGIIPGLALADRELHFGFNSLTTNSDQLIDGIFIQGAGNYTVTGIIPPGTNREPTASIHLSASIQIHQVNALQLAQPIEVTGSEIFTSNLLFNPGVNRPWGMSAQIDFRQALINAGFDPSVDRVTAGEAVITQRMVATSPDTNTSTARILSNDFQVTTSATATEQGSYKLIYNSDSGEVLMAVTGNIINYVLENTGTQDFLTDNHNAFVATLYEDGEALFVVGPPTLGSTFIGESYRFQDLAAGGIGLPLTFNIGAILPAGLSEEEFLSAFDKQATYVADLGTDVTPFDFVYVPEPTSLIAIVLGGMLVGRRRR